MHYSIVGLLGVLTLGLLSPGPDFLLILRNSLGPGRARAFGTVAGISCGLAVQTLAISLGFSALPPRAMRIVQLVGAAYLAYLGLRELLAPAPSAPAAQERRTLSRSRQSFAPSPLAHAPDLRSGFLDGLVCNLTNPKAFIFFVGVFAQVIPPNATAAWRILVPTCVVLHGLVLWSLIVLALHSPPVAGRLAHAQHWLPRAFGLALLALAAWIVFSSATR